MASEIQISESQTTNIEADLADQQNHNQIFKLGFMDSISFKLHGHVKVGSIRRGEHQLDAYLFNCEKHGLQVTTPSGHYELLICPECIKERKAEEKPKADEIPISTIESVATLNKYLNKNIGNK
jgi:hypothetical protein